MADFNKVRKTALFFQGLLNGIGLLKFVEKKVIEKYDPANTSTIFIIGSPRSGSTMLYQHLLACYKFSYITNFGSLFYDYLCTATKLMAKSRYGNNLKRSTFGYIPGLVSPSEAGPLFRKWFEENDVDNTVIRKTVSGLNKILGGPFLAKNMLNSVRIPKIIEVFPGTVFIHLKRDPLYIAQSILLARKKITGSFEGWWSIKPPGMEDYLNMDPFYQVAYQIKLTENKIKDYKSKGLLDSCIEIEYEELCKNSAGTISSIGESLEQSGFVLEKNFITPDEISISKSEERKLEFKDWDKLKGIINEVGIYN